MWVGISQFLRRRRAVHLLMIVALTPLWGLWL
jgi:hypothetical protein